jgi:hypothetical protein
MAESEDDILAQLAVEQRFVTSEQLAEAQAARAAAFEAAGIPIPLHHFLAAKGFVTGTQVRELKRLAEQQKHGDAAVAEPEHDAADASTAGPISHEGTPAAGEAHQNIRLPLLGTMDPSKKRLVIFVLGELAVVLAVLAILAAAGVFG